MIGGLDAHGAKGSAASTMAKTITTMVMTACVGSPNRHGCRVIAASLLALSVGACESPQQRVSNTEDQLAAAGFLLRPANTAERQNMLNTLPPHRFLRRINGDTVTYVYSDPLVCDCLYVGTQEAYGRYRLLLEQQRIADQQELAAQQYNNAAWNWGAWGPWGPGFGFGPGFGW